MQAGSKLSIPNKITAYIRKWDRDGSFIRPANMGVKRKRDSNDWGYERSNLQDIQCNEYVQRTLFGNSVADRRWCTFSIMVEFCCLRLAYQVLGIPTFELDNLARRRDHFVVHKRTLMMAFTDAGEQLLLARNIEPNEARTFIRTWNKCVCSVLVDLNRKFVDICQANNYLVVMRNEFLLPIRAYIREEYGLREPLNAWQMIEEVDDTSSDEDEDNNDD